jgi:hypothetical protein
VSETVEDAHVPEPDTVIVKLTVPEVISAGLGVYTGAATVASLKVPVPVVVQRIAPLLAVATVVYVDPTQIESVAGPAFEVGAGEIVSVNESVTVTPAQTPVPVTLIVSTTDPTVISAALGVYIASKELTSVKVPVPLVDHKIVAPTVAVAVVV